MQTFCRLLNDIMSMQDVTTASDGAYMNDLVFKRNPLTLAVFMP
jgi:hypothetical protein